MSCAARVAARSAAATAKISADDLLEIQPHVAGHVNGGPTALAPEESARLVAEGSEIALQVAQAGNLRSAIHICEEALAAGAFHRLLIATDTPTGAGVVPLGMLHVMSDLASLGPLDARGVVSAATGNVAAVYGLDADLALIDAPVGSSAGDAYAALELGDVPAAACVVTGGCLSFAESRNTPAPARGVSMTGHLQQH